MNSKWKGSITNCRAFPNADIGSDHQLVICNVRLKLRAMKMKTLTQKYETNKLKNATTSEQYRIIIDGHFAPLMDGTVGGAMDVDELWAEIKDAFHETSENVLERLKEGQRKEWLIKGTTKLAKAGT